MSSNFTLMGAAEVAIIAPAEMMSGSGIGGRLQKVEDLGLVAENPSLGLDGSCEYYCVNPEGFYGSVWLAGDGLVCWALK